MGGTQIWLKMFLHITGYKIEYRMGSNDYIPITLNTESTTTSFIHRGLDSDETYSYRVYSINSEGTSTLHHSSSSDQTTTHHNSNSFDCNCNSTKSN